MFVWLGHFAIQQKLIYHIVNQLYFNREKKKKKKRKENIGTKSFDIPPTESKA